MRAVYTINLDSTVCSMAVEVLHRVLRGIPQLRNTMLLGMTAFLARIPEEFPKARPPVFRAEGFWGRASPPLLRLPAASPLGAVTPHPKP